MKKFINLILPALIIMTVNSASFADVKIKQKVSVEGQGMEQTTMIKGARERRETKIVVSEEAGDFMPNIASITQCDLRRTLQVNDKKKLYTADPFGDDAPTPTAPKAATKTVKGGTVTITYTVTVTGERKTMFGLTARHLKILQSVNRPPIRAAARANRSWKPTAGMPIFRLISIVRLTRLTRRRPNPTAATA